MSDDVMIDLSYRIDPDELVDAITRIAEAIRTQQAEYESHLETLRYKLSDLQAKTDQDQHGPILAALDKYSLSHDEEDMRRTVELWEALVQRHNLKDYTE